MEANRCIPHGHRLVAAVNKVKDLEWGKVIRV